MAEKKVLQCDGCQREIENSEVEVLLLGMPTGRFDDALRPIFTPLHTCKACSETFTLAQLNAKLRSRPA